MDYQRENFQDLPSLTVFKYMLLFIKLFMTPLFSRPVKLCTMFTKKLPKDKMKQTKCFPLVAGLWTVFLSGIFFHPK